MSFLKTLRLNKIRLSLNVKISEFKANFIKRIVRPQTSLTCNLMFFSGMDLEIQYYAKGNRSDRKVKNVFLLMWDISHSCRI